MPVTEPPHERLQGLASVVLAAGTPGEAVQAHRRAELERSRPLAARNRDSAPERRLGLVGQGGREGEEALAL